MLLAEENDVGWQQEEDIDVALFKDSDEDDGDDHALALPVVRRATRDVSPPPPPPPHRPPRPFPAVPAPDVLVLPDPEADLGLPICGFVLPEAIASASSSAHIFTVAHQSHVASVCPVLALLAQSFLPGHAKLQCVCHLRHDISAVRDRLTTFVQDQQRRLQRHIQWDNGHQRICGAIWANAPDDQRFLPAWVLNPSGNWVLYKEYHDVGALLHLVSNAK